MPPTFHAARSRAYPKMWSPQNAGERPRKASKAERAARCGRPSLFLFAVRRAIFKPLSIVKGFKILKDFKIRARGRSAGRGP